MKIQLKNIDGQSVGDVELDESVFGVEVNEHLLWEAVKMQRARARAGTVKTKTRMEVRGGGKKPWKQKGTGNARQGSTRAPQWVGGGKVFAPQPRDWSYSMPKKAIKAALRSALSLRAKEGLVVLDGFQLGEIKTKRVGQALDKLGADKALIVDAQNDQLALSTRNLARAKYLKPEGLNVYDLLLFPSLVMTKASLELITERLRPEGGVK
jgi:large subunit ribosomal protein L4